jgi:biopolymer transport protein ExbD
MAMNTGNGAISGEPEVMIEMNATPLIDVMLVLLIMLIITIPIQNHAVNLNMPVGAPPQTQPPQVIRIDIDAVGKVSWNGDVLPDRAMLESRLQNVAAMPTQPEIHLRPNQLVAYKSVMAVMASAQRLGVTKIGLVSAEQAGK